MEMTHPYGFAKKNKDDKEDLLREVLDYFRGRGAYDVSREADEGQTLGELRENMIRQIEDYLDKEMSNP